MINIAIDGPSGAGKSTVAKALAKRLGFVYLDTGAMYRAAALFAQNQGVDVNDEAAVEGILPQLDIRMTAQGVFLAHGDVSEDIRKHSMSKAASDISKHKAVRVRLVEMQRQIAASGNCVLDGRDIGTYVLPNARYKFYLTASVAERARRRFSELEAKGGNKSTLQDIQRDIEERDYNDMNRDFAPLRQAEDAVLVDSSSMSIDEVVEYMRAKITAGSPATEALGGRLNNPSDTALPVGSGKINNARGGSPQKPRRIGYRIFRFLLSPIARLLFPTKVIGKKKMVYGRRVVYAVANHYSTMDTVPLGFRLFKRDFNVLMKQEAYKNAPRFFKFTGGIPVERGEADIKAIRTCIKILNQDRPLVIFPEGTRTKIKDGTELLPFKPGAVSLAIRTKSPVIPILLYRSPKIFRRNWVVIGDVIDYSGIGGRNSETVDRLTLELMDVFRNMRTQFDESRNR